MHRVDVVHYCCGICVFYVGGVDAFHLFSNGRDLGLGSNTVGGADVSGSSRSIVFFL